MKVLKVRLYSTLLDDQYKNVYDEYNSYNEYLNFLGTPMVEYTSAKSYQISDLSMKITVSDDALKILNANYCCIDYETEGSSGLLFFFITSIRSLHDTRNATCELSLKFDSFTNNYFDFSPNSKNIIGCAHYQNAKFGRDEQDNETYLNVNNAYITDVKNIKSINERTVGDRIIWRYYTLVDDKVDEKDITTDDVIPNPKGLYPYDTNIKVYAVPIRYAHGTTIYSISKIRIGGVLYDVRHEQDDDPDDPYITSSWLSSNAPFYYSVDNFDYVDNIIDISIPIDYNIVPCKVRANIRIALEFALTCRLEVDEYKSYTYEYSIYDYDVSPYCSLRNISYIDPSTNAPYTQEKLAELEPGVHSKFYKTNLVRIGDAYFMPEIPVGFCGSVKFKYKYLFDSFLYWYEYYNENNELIIKTPAEIYCWKIDYPFSVSALKSWFDQSAVATATGSMKDITRGVVSLMTARGYGGFIAPKGNLAKQQYKISGADSILSGVIDPLSQIVGAMNKPDYYKETAYPYTKIDVYVDSPIRCDVIVDYEDELRVFNFTHRFGSNIEKMGDVKTNNRTVFDYIRTESCFLPEIHNNMQKSDLESAFDRGITKWHISSINRNELNREALKKFITYLPNTPKEF